MDDDDGQTDDGRFATAISTVTLKMSPGLNCVYKYPGQKYPGQLIVTLEMR